MMTTRLRAAAAVLPLLFLAGEASAAGLYFSDRGVRPLGRGGAFIAGADDLHSIWYNPAGLADAGSSVLFDLAWLRYEAEFKQVSLVTQQGTGATLVDETAPAVKGTTPILPIPTLAGSYNFGPQKEWTVAGGILAPYTPIASYPLTIDNQPSPARYSLVTMDGSLLVVPSLHVAYKPVDWIRFGVGVQALAGSFQSQVVFSAALPGEVIGPPQDTKYDALSELKVGPIFAPSGNAGIIVVPHQMVRIGLSGQLPFAVNSPATVRVRLPSASFFDGAYQQGDKAHVEFWVPAVLRVGVEVRPVQDVRIEAAYVREFWSAHDKIAITPENIELYNVKTLPSPFAVSPISLPRGFQDTHSFRLGAQYKFPVDAYALEVRTGFYYEPSAIPPEYESPLTTDVDKMSVSLGGGLYVGKNWRFDLTYAHVFSQPVNVSPYDAKLKRVSPVQGNPADSPAINGGRYSVNAGVLGVGLEYKFL